MASLVLGPALRHVAPTTATVWVETDAPAEVGVLGSTARTFQVAGHHYALVVVRGLEPGSRTEYTLDLDGEQAADVMHASAMAIYEAAVRRGAWPARPEVTRG